MLIKIAQQPNVQEGRDYATLEEFGLAVGPYATPARMKDSAYFGLKPGNSDNTDAYNLALGALNNDEYDALFIPPGGFNLEGPVSSITRSG
jgi:hypothetical protein